MDTAIVRNIQVGVALVVLTAVIMALAVIVDFMSGSEAVRIGLNVSAVIGVVVVGGIVLSLVFGAGQKRDADE